MLNDLIFSFLLPLGGSLITLLIGYFIFRTDQKNKNKAVDTRFDTVSNDIKKNDERIRRDFVDQNKRVDKSFDRIDKEIIGLHDTQISQGQTILATELGVANVNKSLDKMDKKLDRLIEAHTSRQ